MDDDDDEVDSYSSSSGKRSEDQPESEKDSDVSGVWIVGNVEEMDEEVSDAFGEDGAEQHDGFKKNREDRRDVFSKIHADQGDGFGFFIRGEGRAHVRRKRATRKARADEIGAAKSVWPS